MTSEVALMNRSAVVLAADSAATVRFWDNGRKVERYFKGANKIFNISTSEPVGAMIYDAADFQGMPWEVIIKGYRDSRLGKSHDTLAAYPDDLFDFIVSEGHLFPVASQLHAFFEYSVDAGARICRTISSKAAPKSNQPADIIAAQKEAYEILSGMIRNADYLGTIDDAFAVSAAKHIDDVASKLVVEEAFQDVASALTASQIAEIAIVAVFKNFWSTMQTTGLVIAGYGNKEYLPQLVHYNCYGIIFGKLIHEKLHESCKSIDGDNGSQIVPLAQSSMVKTFMYGAGEDSLDKIDEFFDDAIVDYDQCLRKAGHLGHDVDTEKLRAAAKSKFNEDTAVHLWF